MLIYFMDDITRLRNTLDLSKFGVGESKSFESLVNELESGKVSISWYKNKPIRHVKVIFIRVICLEKQLILRKSNHFSNGMDRIINDATFYAGIKANKDPYIATMNILKQNLNLNLDDKTINSRLFLNSYSFSGVKDNIYPGVQTSCNENHFVFFFPESLANQEYTNENQNNHFKWEDYQFSLDLAWRIWDSLRKHM